jgi:hypothetical protein
MKFSDREFELINRMIENYEFHASKCSHIKNIKMASRQKAWDFERITLLKKIQGLMKQSKGGVRVIRIPDNKIATLDWEACEKCRYYNDDGCKLDYNIHISIESGAYLVCNYFEYKDT